MLHLFDRRILASVAAAVVLAVGAPIAISQIQSNGAAVVNTGRLNLRAGPSVGFAVITTLNQGDDLELIGRNEDSSWVEVRISDGTTGWVSSLYILTNADLGALPVTGFAEPQAFVTTGRLNLRAGPGTNYPILLVLTQNDPVSLIARSPNGVWLNVRAFDVEGWVNAGFIGSQTPFSTLPTVNVPVPTPTGPDTDALPAPGAEAEPSVPIYGIGIANQLEVPVREAPSVTAPVIVVLESGMRFSLAGRDATSGWVLVVLDDGRTGWVNSASIGLSIFLTDLPVVQ